MTASLALRQTTKKSKPLTIARICRPQMLLKLVKDEIIIKPFNCPGRVYRANLPHYVVVEYRLE